MWWAVKRKTVTKPYIRVWDSLTPVAVGTDDGVMFVCGGMTTPGLMLGY